MTLDYWQSLLVREMTRKRGNKSSRDPKATAGLNQSTGGFSWGHFTWKPRFLTPFEQVGNVATLDSQKVIKSSCCLLVLFGCRCQLSCSRRLTHCACSCHPPVLVGIQSCSHWRALSSTEVSRTPPPQTARPRETRDTSMSFPRSIARNQRGFSINIEWKDKGINGQMPVVSV